MEIFSRLSEILSLNHIIVAYTIYLATSIVYRLVLHPLARFPGPKLAAATRWYEAYHDIIRNGQYTSKIAELHEKHGTFLGGPDSASLYVSVV